MAAEIAYRISAWDTPLRVNANRTPGRYNLAESPATQYLGLHPLTPWAEYLRTNELKDPERLAERRLRIWVLQVDLSDAVVIDFDSVHRYGLDPDDLVADDHTACQQFAERLRLEPSPPSAIVVPSAALPGTRNLIIFGERVRIPYDWEPIDDVDLPACVVAERSQPPDGINALVRFVGETHEELVAWRKGDIFPPPEFG